MISQKNPIFDNYFLNVNFLITIAYTDLKFCFLILHTYSEGTVSQNFDLGLSFYSMPKIGKLFVIFVNIIFVVT